METPKGLISSGYISLNLDNIAYVTLGAKHPDNGKNAIAVLFVGQREPTYFVDDDAKDVQAILDFAWVKVPEAAHA